ncbi:MAG TPA: ribulose-phosphate 3-epimerase [Bacteroides sp.]|nr:ribulose-phosphate 3-epimerase [Bacteroides sp.]
MSHLIAPSILTASFLELGKEIDMINKSEADWIHLDIMDGVFVPNLTFGFHVIRQMRKITDKPLDTHLMIVEPEKHLEEFRKSGVDKLTVHYEACPNLAETVRAIKSLGMSAGVAISPDTPTSVLADILPELDLVLNMTVHPGYGAQKFIKHSWEKIRQLRQMIDNSGSNAIIQIDGGVGLGNIGGLRDAGVDCFVVGNTIFASDDPYETITQLKSL